MKVPDKSPRAGGFVLMVAILLGTVAGVLLGQPSAGVVGGVVVGTAAAVALWLKDRGRIGW